LRPQQGLRQPFGRDLTRAGEGSGSDGQGHDFESAPGQGDGTPPDSVEPAKSIDSTLPPSDPHVPSSPAP
jgi:hypothetical protein